MAEEKEVKDKKRKCAVTGKNLKRVKRYFRNGLYFANKAAFKTWEKTKKEEAEKTAAESKAKEAPAEAAAEKKE